MPLPSHLVNVAGAIELCDWFGYWPTFHDAEIIRLSLNRSEPSTVEVYTWKITGQVDKKGYYLLTKHVLVEFLLHDVIELDLSGFSKQNVIAGLDVQKTDRGYLLGLSPCYGLAGTIETTSLSIRLRRGILQK